MVAGDSMRPTVATGRPAARRLPPDAACRATSWSPACPVACVAVKRAAERRTTELGEPGWWLLSDNPSEGSDSRQLRRGRRRATCWPWSSAGSGRWCADALCQTRTVPDPTHPFAGDPVFDLHVGGKMEVRSTVGLGSRDDLSLAYTPGRRAGLRGDRRGPVADPALHVGAQHRRRRHRRHGGARAGRHRPGGGDAGDGGQGGPVQGVRWRGRRPDLPRHHRRRGDHRDGRRGWRRRFGGINLEDISAPRCFEIEDRLKERLDIPVFHDDQHGTAVVALAALTNALQLTGRDPGSTRVVISGAGAAGVAVAKILLEAGIKDLAVTDRKGVLHSSRGDLTPVKRALAALTADQTGRSGTLADVLDGADVYIGVSGGTVPEEDVATDGAESIIFGLANPDPEVHPDVAHKYARVVATGRSDFPNQINNVLAFPGIFRGAFDVHATAITEGMKLAAADRAGRPGRRRPGRGPDRALAVRPAGRPGGVDARWPRPPAGRRRAGLSRRATARVRRRSARRVGRRVVATVLIAGSGPMAVARPSRWVCDREAARSHASRRRRSATVGTPGRAKAHVADRGWGRSSCRGVDVDDMFAVYAESFNPDDPLSGLVVGERPDPEVPDGWTTIDGQGGVAQPPRPVLAARGRAQAGAAADDPRHRRRRPRRGRQRGRRARGDQRARAGTGDETFDPKRSLLSERHQGAMAERVAVPAPQRRAQAGLAVVRGGGLPADRLADGVPDALHPRRAEAGRDRARPGRRRRRGDGRDRARPGGRAAGARDQPRRGQAGEGARDRRPRGVRVRRPAARRRPTR